jgi:RNA polymerase sigma-70 factor (sigma-E family)
MTDELPTWPRTAPRGAAGWGLGAGLAQERTETQATVAESDAAAGTAALFAEHHTRMLRVASVLLADPAMAEDVVQDAYVSVYSAWGRIRDRDAAVGYLHRSVVNGARSRMRRRVVAQKHQPEPLPDTASAEDVALAAHAGGPLVRALRQLPRREREVVLLRHYLDLSERQTADALGLRPGSVKAYGSRGLAALRVAMGEPDALGARMDQERGR